MEEQKVDELCAQLESELDHPSKKPTAFDLLMRSKTKKEWAGAEANRGLGYNGQPSKTERTHAKIARDKAQADKITQKGYVFDSEMC